MKNASKKKSIKLHLKEEDRNMQKIIQHSFVTSSYLFFVVTNLSVQIEL